MCDALHLETEIFVKEISSFNPSVNVINWGVFHSIVKEEISFTKFQFRGARHRT